MAIAQFSRAGASIAVPPRTRLIALIIASALFMEQMDGTVLATALPSMARSFNVDPLHTSIALTSYMLSLAVFIPASGPVADRFGSRNVLMTAISVFLFGSILCAQSQGLWTMALSRGIQGMGGAMMVPVGRLILLRSVPKSGLVSAMFWMMAPATLAPLLGPVIGGFLTTWLSWHWIFYINVPVGLVGLELTRRFIPQIREERTDPFDGRGFVLSGAGLASLVLGLELVSRGDTARWAPLALGAGCVVAALLYWQHARRSVHPLLDFTLMKYETFRISVIAGTMSRIGVGAMPFLLPSFLQIGFGLNAAQSGLVVFAAPIGALISRFFARRLFRRYGFRRILVVSAGLVGMLYIFFGLFRPGWSYGVLSCVLLLSGVVQALQFMAYNSMAYAEVPPDRMSAATSFYTTFQQVTLSLGVCIAAGSMALSRSISHHPTSLPIDFTVGFWAVGLISLASGPISARLRPDAGSEISR